MNTYERNAGWRNGVSKVRGGSVLVIVLVLVMLLALGAYTFTELMVSEVEATAMYEREVQARAFADSGIELAAAVLGERNDLANAVNVYDNPDLFQAVLMRTAENPRGQGAFSIVAPLENDPTSTAVRFGLVDESGKINLNTLLDLDLDAEQQRDLLLELPEMTAEVADAILDWLDPDEQPRQMGAENEYYGTLNPPYSAKNGRLETLDELLEVRGVTTWLLYGEDANRNGLLDPNENDGDVSLPLDNADGVLQRGWNAYLTVLSREANLRADGTLRIDVNQENLADLFDQVEAAFDEETALFVTAFRLNGPISDDSSTGGSGGSGGSNNQSGGSSGRGGGSRGGNQNGGGGGSGGQSGNSDSDGDEAGSEDDMRAGLDLSGGGSQQIESLFDLVGVSVEAEVDGMDKTLQSPWTDDASSLTADLPELLDKLTTNGEEFIEGRINIGQAPREVLLAIPDIDEQLVESIVAAQQSGASTAYGAGGTRTTSGWLLIEGLIDLEQMRSLDRYVTGRGDVFRVQAVGYFGEGGPTVRLEAVIDATQLPPQILSVRDLSELGRGYSLQQISQSQSATGTGF